MDEPGRTELLMAKDHVMEAAFQRHCKLSIVYIYSLSVAVGKLCCQVRFVHGSNFLRHMLRSRGA